MNARKQLIVTGAQGFVAGLGAQGVMARPSLVIGLPLLGAGNSFLVRMIADFKERRAAHVPVEEIRTLDELIRQIESSELSAEDLANQQRRFESSRGFRDVFEMETADEEEPENGIHPKVVETVFNRYLRPTGHRHCWPRILQLF